MTSLAPTLQAYFTTRLTSQYGASPHTVAAYRDTWRLLLGYAAQTTGTAPVDLDLSRLDADLINGFLTDLERQVFERLIGIEIRPRVAALADAALGGDAEVLRADARTLPSRNPRSISRRRSGR